MYLKHWKLIAPPFRERVDAASFFPAAGHQAALFQLRAAIAEQAGCVFLAGPAGCGKSMLATVLADHLADSTVRVMRGDFSTLKSQELLGKVLALPLPARVAGGRGGLEQANALIEALDAFFPVADPGAPHRVALLEGATHLSEREFRNLVLALRSLASFRPAPITPILIGPTQLLAHATRLTGSHGRALRRCVLGGLSRGETAAYVSHCVRRAGGAPTLFCDAALELMFDLSGGLPRRINRLGDLSLLVAYAQGATNVEAQEVWTAQTELRVLGATRTATCRTHRRWKPLVHHA